MKKFLFLLIPFRRFVPPFKKDALEFEFHKVYFIEKTYLDVNLGNERLLGGSALNFL
jgi:hypothetical protein